MRAHEPTVDQIKALLSALGHRAEVEGIERLNAEEQTVLRPWAALGVIGNGGFGYFFEGDWDLASAAEGFRALGFPAVGAACEEVLGRLRTQGPLPTGMEGRAEWHEQIDWDQFEAQEDVVFELSFDVLARAVGWYVNAHRGAFEGRNLPLGPLLRVVR